MVVRSPFEDMKASPWEKEDAMHEGIPIYNNHVPVDFVLEEDRPLLTIGRPFEPATGNDDKDRLCQPTDVAVASSGLVFIADGYVEKGLPVI